MKIGFVNDHFSPILVGGLELFIKELAEYFSQEGFEIVVFTTEQNQNSADGFPLYKIKSSPFHLPYFHGVPGLVYYQLPGVTTPWMYFNFGLQRRLRKIYAEEKIDVLYIHTLRQVSFAPLQAAGNIPVVLHVHEYFPFCFTRDFARCNKEPYMNKSILKCAHCMGEAISPPLVSSYSAPILTPFLFLTLLIENYMRRKYLKLPAEIICDSNFVATVLANHGYKSRVIPTPFLREIKEINRVNREENDVFRILFVGRLERRKGADLLLDISQELKGRINFRIDVIGTGYLLDRLDRRDLNIYVHGFLGEERFKLFEKADCLLALSRWPEPLGMVGQEAMAYGIPTIGFGESGGLAEQIIENGSGLVAESEKDVVECIMRIYRDTELRETIKRNCSVNIKRYDKQKIFKELKDIFLKLKLA